MRLSIIVPVYNECRTIAEVLRRVLAVEVEKQVIVVDDGSSDGTAEWLTSWARSRSEQIVICQHAKNRGKGAAVRTGLAEVSGECVLIQDGDLEYNPEDYARLLAPVAEGRAKVVYGSRFLDGAPRMFLAQRIGNVFLTRLTNLLYGASLTDMETCYKLFTRDVVTGFTLVSNRFDVEPELTAKVLRAGLEIKEVPITYAGRSYREGKKINWRDFVSAIWTLVRFRL
ncbi:MAG: glycosyl transferase [Acidimicrobiaceae bacterium]|nr:glycosyl transferase [Acidimicrobiaceae bacterium]